MLLCFFLSLVVLFLDTIKNPHEVCALHEILPFNYSPFHLSLLRRLSQSVEFTPSPKKRAHTRSLGTLGLGTRFDLVSWQDE